MDLGKATMTAGRSVVYTILAVSSSREGIYQERSIDMSP